MKDDSPLIVITGPTASGKTSLAINLAKRFNGEIICADSRTVYRHMNIGTAKPDKAEQAIVPHWGLDLVEPGERFTAADFKRYAEIKIEEIRKRRHVPFLVGGTGLYIDSIIFDYQFGDNVDDVLRQSLNKLTIDELQAYCHNNNIILPENLHNKRYLIRAIEQKSINNKRSQTPISNSVIVGIATNREELRTRIGLRSEQLFDNAVVKEATILGEKYDWDNESMTGNIYPLVRLYLENKISYEEMKVMFTTADWRLAKRQLTWLRRNPYIKWLNLSEAKVYIEDILANE